MLHWLWDDSRRQTVKVGEVDCLDYMLCLTLSLLVLLTVILIQINWFNLQLAYKGVFQ